MTDVLKVAEGNLLGFWCPGCKDVHHVRVNIHGIGPKWRWNGSLVRPTFDPSILVRSGHYAKPGKPCWCSYNAEHPEEQNSLRFKCEQCHSFIRDGQIQFLGDCSHELAGKTVPLPAWRES